MLDRLMSIGWRRSCIATLVAVVGVLGESQVRQYLHLDGYRNALSQFLLEKHWQPIEPKVIHVVLIDDEEYWRGQLAGRSPTKRDYIALLVDVLDRANAQTIAIDFDMRLPDSTRFADFEDYRVENAKLRQSILEAARHRKIVLSKSVRYVGEGRYALEPDIYQLFGLCMELDRGRWVHDPSITHEIGEAAAANITCGYIALTFDKRRLPMELLLAGSEGRVESFALAVARAQNPNVLRKGTNAEMYGSYIRPVTTNELGFMHLAGSVLRQEVDTLEGLAGHPVIVGSGWSSLAYKHGPRVDLHATPVGMMSGALIHANFSEAFLDGRTYGHISQITLNILEFGFALMVALALALSGRVAIDLLLLVAASAVMIGIQWLLLHLFGVFFEAFLPMLGVWFHSLIERFISR